MTQPEVREVGGDTLAVHYGDRELFRYVFRPDAPPVEAPQPYLHPVRTLTGELLTLHRPWDHPWHKGIALSMPNVGAANFWGGGMQLLRPDGEFVQVEHNGSQEHQEFDRVEVTDGTVGIDERLHWYTEQRAHWFTETRRIGAFVLPDDQAWVLTFKTELRNVSGQPIEFGSPSTNGRPDAGYSGLFWRGTRELGHGTILAADGPGGPEAMGIGARWLAYVGRHDGSHASSTIVFVDDPDNVRHPTPWFVRSVPYACVSTAPFFHQVLALDDGATLELRYTLVFAAGGWDSGQVESVLGRVVRTR